MCEFSITLCVLVFLSKTRLGGFLFNWRFSFTLDWPTQLNVLSAAWARILSFRNMACKFISKCKYILMYVCGHLFLYWTENLILCVQWFLLVLNYALVSLLWRRICLFLFLFLQKLKFCNQTKKKTFETMRRRHSRSPHCAQRRSNNKNQAEVTLPCSPIKRAVLSSEYAAHEREHTFIETHTHNAIA